jgi:hypothetical protein
MNPFYASNDFEAIQEPVGLSSVLSILAELPAGRVGTGPERNP